MDDVISKECLGKPVLTRNILKNRVFQESVIFPADRVCLSERVELFIMCNNYVELFPTLSWCNNLKDYILCCDV